MTATVLEPLSALRTSPANPFKALDYYEPGDQGRFDGRDAAISAVASGITRHRTFVLYGPSGSGKTSLILAGLYPELDKRGYGAVYVRTLNDPLTDLATALRTFLATPNTELDEYGAVYDLIARATALQPLVIVFDQFEEFFVRFRDEHATRASFVNTLADLLSRDLDFHVLFSLRQEYLAELDELRGILPLIQHNEYRLPLLTAFGARQSVARQLTASGVPFDPDFLTGVVDELAEVGFDPTMLQIVCSEAYANAVRRNPDDIRLRNADVPQGGLKSLFQKYLTELASGLDKDIALPTRAVLYALTTREGTKRSATEDELLDAGFVIFPQDLTKVLQLLIDARLIRRDARTSPVRYELLHERLVPHVMEWLNTDVQFAAFHRAQNVIRDSVAAELYQEHADALLAPGIMSDVVRPWQRYLALDEKAREFVFLSAVRGCVDNERLGEAVRFWAESFDSDALTALLRKHCGHGDSSMRAGAATAAGMLKVEPLAESCLNLALSDADDYVRGAAGESLATLGRVEHYRSIKNALQDHTTREAALTALARRRRAGGALPYLNPLQRFQMSRHARSELADNLRKQLRIARRDSVIVGSRTGVLWGLTVGALALVLAMWTRGQRWADPGYGSLALVGAVVTTAFAGLVFANLIAPSVAAQGTKKRMLLFDPSWFRIATRSFVPSLIIGLGVLTLVFVDTEMVAAMLFLSDLTAWVTAPLLFLTLVVLFGVLVEWHRWAIGGSTGRTSPYGWSVLISAGFPITFFAAMQAPVTNVRDGGFAFICTIFALAISFLASVAGMTLHREASLSSKLIERRARPRETWAPVGSSRVAFARWSAVVFFAVNVFGFFWLFGADTVPLRVNATADTLLVGSFGPGFPDADYRRLRVAQSITETPAIFRVRSSDPGENIRVEGISVPDGSYLQVASFVTNPWIAISSSSFQPAYSVRVNQIPVLEAGDTMSGHYGRPQFYAIKLAVNSQQPDTLRGVVPRDSLRPSTRVAIGFLNLYPAPRKREKFSGYIVAAQAGAIAPREWRIRFEDRAVAGSIIRQDDGVSVSVSVDSAGKWMLPVLLGRDEFVTTTRDSLRVVAAVLLVDSLARPHPSHSDEPTPDEIPRAVLRGLDMVDSAIVAFARTDTLSAAELFGAAAGIAQENKDAYLANAVCWRGALRGYAIIVLRACERAVELVPISNYRDSRGVARAATGDVRGAIADFQDFLDSGSGSEYEVMHRRMWIEDLMKGNNQFRDPAFLKQIRESPLDY